MTVYSNPHDVRIAGAVVSGVAAVRLEPVEPALPPAVPHDDGAVTVVHAVASAWRGMIELIDPADADALAGAAGELTFAIRDEAGAARTVTCAGARIGCAARRFVWGGACQVSLPVTCLSVAGPA